MHQAPEKSVARPRQGKAFSLIMAHRASEPTFHPPQGDERNREVSADVNNELTVQKHKRFGIVVAKDGLVASEGLNYGVSSRNGKSG